MAKLPAINSTSTADIAFIILIFFLMTTTMNVDSGIQRILPPIPPDEQQEAEINERNILLVRVNANNAIMVAGEIIDVSQVKDKVIEFVQNPYNEANLSDKEEKEVDQIGTVMVSRGVVSLQNDRGTSYATYIQVQNELSLAFKELRDQAARRHFNKPYDELNETQKSLINEAVPQKISEALPRSNA